MKNIVAAGAVLAACLSTVSADFCSEGSTNTGGNYYCQAVKAVTYRNFGSSGQYNRISYMNTATGQCLSEPQSYSGSLAPLDDEVSMHFRGPIQLKRFAFYSPGNHAKRSTHDSHHAHMAFHNRLDMKKRTEVTATINGVPVSWAMNAAAPTTDAASSGSNGGAVDLKAPYKPPAPAAAGNWVRAAFYDAQSQVSQGLTFLNNMGGQGSGNFNTLWGNSLSYASSNGQSGSASPQVLADTTLPSNTEVIAMSDRPCNGDSCGYSRPGTVAHHGFGGRHKLFAFEFSMPADDSGAFNANMPAIWMLNAQIPRTVQYPKNPDCSCWASGCGEFDLFEVLTSPEGSSMMKSTLHGTVQGGDSDYFNRPFTGTMKAAVLMSESQAHLKVLHDSFDFGHDIPPAFIDQLAKSTDDQSNGVSLFDLA